LDSALRIAKSNGTDITNVFRIALAEFVRTRASLARGERMDEFLDSSEMSDLNYNRILTPGELRNWSENSIFHAAKTIRSRKQALPRSKAA